MNSTLLKNLFIGIFLLLSVCNTAYADEVPVPSKAQIECERLNSLGWEVFAEGNYPEALKKFTKAGLIAEKNNLIGHVLVSKIYMAKAFDQMSNLGEALKYFLEALEIANKYPGAIEQKLRILSNIGGIYYKEKDYELALKYSMKAYEEGKEAKILYNRFFSGTYISNIYAKLHDYKQARKYLEEIKDIPKSNEDELIWHVNYAEIFFIEGHVDKAQKIIEDVLKSVDSKNEKTCYLCVVNLLSKIYAEKGQLDKAIYYAITGLDNSHSIGDSIESYEILSKLYFKKKDYDNAFKYKDLLLTAKDSLSGIVNRDLLEANKVKLDIQDYKIEAAHYKDKQEAERNLFILAIILCLFIFFFIYRWLKNRIIKQKQEKIISENNQKIADLELEGINNNIAEKNRKLSANALYLSVRNELIEEIVDSLSKIPAINLNENAISNIKTLKEHLKVDEEWDDFITYFEQVNPEFMNELQNKHPQLTDSDIRFVCYMYMNLDIKEISTIFNISVEACRKRRQRIAKKMDIEIDAVHEYILKIT
ncbi:Tetratricopeptide repeat protein [compost metagenome]